MEQDKPVFLPRSLKLISEHFGSAKPAPLLPCCLPILQAIQLSGIWKKQKNPKKTPKKKTTLTNKKSNALRATCCHQAPRWPRLALLCACNQHDLRVLNSLSLPHHSTHGRLSPYCPHPGPWPQLLTAFSKDIIKPDSLLPDELSGVSL